MELCENHAYSHITNIKIVTFSYCVPIRQENFQKIRSNNIFRLCYSFQNGIPFSIWKYYSKKLIKGRLIIPAANCLSGNSHIKQLLASYGMKHWTSRYWIAPIQFWIVVCYAIYLASASLFCNQTDNRHYSCCWSGDFRNIFPQLLAKFVEFIEFIVGIIMEVTEIQKVIIYCLRKQIGAFWKYWQNIGFFVK